MRPAGIAWIAAWVVLACWPAADAESPANA
jgi:hypothetical protein